MVWGQDWDFYCQVRYRYPISLSKLLNLSHQFFHLRNDDRIYPDFVLLQLGLYKVIHHGGIWACFMRNKSKNFFSSSVGQSQLLVIVGIYICIRSVQGCVQEGFSRKGGQRWILHLVLKTGNAYSYFCWQQVPFEFVKHFETLWKSALYIKIFLV